MKIHTIIYGTLNILVNDAWSVSVAGVWARYPILILFGVHFIMSTLSPLCKDASQMVEAANYPCQLQQTLIK